MRNFALICILIATIGAIVDVVMVLQGAADWRSGLFLFVVAFVVVALMSAYLLKKPKSEGPRRHRSF